MGYNYDIGDEVLDLYGIFHITKDRTVYLGGNNKYNVIYHVIYYNDESLEVSIPHYFESIGTKRKFIKALEKNKLKNRNLKIQKIKEKLCGVL